MAALEGKKINLCWSFDVVTITHFLVVYRKIDEKDVKFTAVPGHVAGFGALVARIGRGAPRSISCGKEFSVVCTYPYEGPDLQVATKLMEEAKIREQEAQLAKQKNDHTNDG